MSAVSARKQDPEDIEVPQGFELIDGELVEKETSGEHARAQAKLTIHLGSPFDRRSGGPPDRPGGWYFETEALIRFTPTKKYRPDVAGWRRDKVAAPPSGEVITEIPAWICEVVSPRNASNDTVRKMRDYHRAQVGHYWLLDPRASTLEVHRWTPDGYLVVLSAERGEKVKAEPFEAIEMQVGVFFGDDE